MCGGTVSVSQVPLTCGEHGSPAGPQQPAEPPHLPSRPAGVPATSRAEGAASAALLSLPSPLSQDSCVGSSLGPLGPPPLPQGRHRAECQPPLLLWCLPHVAGTPPPLPGSSPSVLKCPLSSNALPDSLCPQVPSLPGCWAPTTLTCHCGPQSPSCSPHSIRMCIPEGGLSAHCLFVCPAAC